jgi:outer membrane protein OmpA-like peptidoglycan-associated protein
MMLSIRGLTASAVLVASALAVMPGKPDAQVLDRLKKRAKAAAENETLNQVDRMVRDKVRCMFNDLECIQKAEGSGKGYVLTEEDGEVLVDEDGAPITDTAKLPTDKQAAVGTAPAIDPNFDFEPGTDVLYAEDYANDNVGDVPRSMSLARGNWDIVERGGQRFLRNTGPRFSALKIPLPEALPEMFTIELDVLLPTGNVNLVLATSVPSGSGRANRVQRYESNYFDIGSWGVGVASRGDANPKAVVEADDVLLGKLVPIRIMADGQYVKMFVGTRRVANVPNANLVRSDTLWIENTYAASEARPILIGAIGVAAGGRDLYDVLEAKGRVAVRNILFDTDKSTIKPESEAVLSDIGAMLIEHPDLSLLIEGHTDAEGGFDLNMKLSADRAMAVKAWLVEHHDIDEDRLRTVGLGPSQPVGDNDTAEGRALNRRVELVRMDGGRI